MNKFIKIPLKVIKALSPLKNNLGKMKKYKIVMMGGYGCKNIGDEAMTRADIINIRKFLGSDVEIVMLSPNPKYTENYHHERSIKDLYELGQRPNIDLKSTIGNLRAAILSCLFIYGAYLQKKGIRIGLWKNARLVLDELATCDLIYSVGGGILNSIIPQELYKKGIFYVVAYILNKPIVISGQTIGPFTKKMDKGFARFCLNKADLITFRDRNTSYERLVEIGVNKPILKDTADDAITLPDISCEIVKKIFFEEFGEEWCELSSNLTIAMNLKGSLKVFKERGKRSDISAECNLMAQIADRLIEEFHSKIIFIPTEYCAGIDDRDLHEDIIKKMKNGSMARMIQGEYDDVTLKGLIGSCDVAIGARYHFCIFAASKNVPFLGIASGIYQQTKLKGLADLCDLPQCYVQDDMSFTNLEEIWPKVEWIVRNRNYIKNKLRIVIPDLKIKSVSTTEYIIELLRSKGEPS